VIYIYPLVAISKSLIRFSNSRLKSRQDKASPCLNPTDVANCSDKLSEF